MLIKQQSNIEWAPHPNEVEVVLSDQMPPLELCTSAYVFAFRQTTLLMADLDRGVDIPGGHIDPGEHPEEAMRREVLEETGAVIGHARLMGVQKVTLKGPKPENYPYPYPVSYQLMYFSADFQLGEFRGDDDSAGPMLVDRESAGHISCLQRNREIYEHAVLLASQKKSPRPAQRPMR